MLGKLILELNSCTKNFYVAGDRQEVVNIDTLELAFTLHTF